MYIHSNKSELNMKHFGKIIWVMIFVAAILGATTSYMIGSRLEQMETNINEINAMLKDLSTLGNAERYD
jgi:membrane protein DedA with SNARE-associated domain